MSQTCHLCRFQSHSDAVLWSYLKPLLFYSLFEIIIYTTLFCDRWFSRTILYLHNFCSRIHHVFWAWGTCGKTYYFSTLRWTPLCSSLLTQLSSPFPGTNTSDAVISDPLTVGLRWFAGAQPNSPSRSTSHQPYKEKTQEKWKQNVERNNRFCSG